MFFIKSAATLHRVPRTPATRCPCAPATCAPPGRRSRAHAARAARRASPPLAPAGVGQMGPKSEEGINVAQIWVHPGQILSDSGKLESIPCQSCANSDQWRPIPAKFGRGNGPKLAEFGPILVDSGPGSNLVEVGPNLVAWDLRRLRPRLC